MMIKWLTDVTINKKTSLEKLAATQVMLSCKSFKMTINTFYNFNMTYWICLSQIKENMLNHEENYSKSVPG